MITFHRPFFRGHFFVACTRRQTNSHGLAFGQSTTSSFLPLFFLVERQQRNQIFRVHYDLLSIKPHACLFVFKGEKYNDASRSFGKPLALNSFDLYQNHEKRGETMRYVFYEFFPISIEE